MGIEVSKETYKRIIEFLTELRTPDGYGYSVTQEVREEARKLYFMLVLGEKDD